MGTFTDRRSELFERIDAIAPVLAGDAALGEELRRLPDTTLAAIRDAGLLRLKLPECLGGDEAEPELQFDVFERVALVNASAAWCLFIYADSLGAVCARLPDGGVERLLAGRDVPVVCGGGGLRPGKLQADGEGYRLTGRFRYGSGIHGAEWVLLQGLLAGVDGRPPKVKVLVVPKDAVEVEDTWHVLGMRATGSNDFAVNDVFVPEELTYSPGIAPRRGGRVYRTGIVGFLGYPVPAVTLGIARRALDELIALASTMTRGYARPQVLASRAAFQSFLGAADQRLKAARALMIADGDNLMARAEDRGADLRALEAGTRAAGAFAVRTAADVLADTVRFAGGAALQQGTVFEKAVRDLTVAANHLLVNESAYENHAQFLLGIDGADPLA